jgi:hypothetical protein
MRVAKWNIQHSQNLRRGVVYQFQKYCSQATMEKSPNGDAKKRNGAHSLSDFLGVNFARNVRLVPDNGNIRDTPTVG